MHYYLVYLEQFPDHQSVSQQYTLRWRLGIQRIIPAYCIVGALAIASIYITSVREFFKIRSNRIFFCWFLVAFLLANHEVFMTARQPIHFTRGYIWTSLFLLGLPALQYFNKSVNKKFGKAGLALFAAVFFMDNFIWIAELTLSKATQPYPTYITKEQKHVLQTLDKVSSNKTLVISNDNTIAYLTAVYTKAYPWYSHMYTTPFSEKKRYLQELFFKAGRFDTSWKNREINFVLQKKDSLAISLMPVLKTQKVLETAGYYIYRYTPY